MQTILNPRMQEATDGLINNLLASEVFIRYRQAQAGLKADHQARTLLEQLFQMQAELRKKQADGGVTPGEIDALRKLQEKVQHNKVILAYAQTQQEAVNFLREINVEISQLLGIDFASFTNHASC